MRGVGVVVVIVVWGLCCWAERAACRVAGEINVVVKGDLLVGLGGEVAWS